MSKRSKKRYFDPKVALCYIRQSVTRDKDDTNSPERQRANIQAICDQNDWIPEWYEDVDGHRSGRGIKNRPGWLALKKRLGHPDVVALVANDLARLHRKGWRVGDLLEQLEKHGITLILAAPGREVDTSTPLGKIFIQFTAMFDEYYAEDISQRAKDSVAYRKSQGKTIGAPPFGTIRNEQGYLIPSPEGAWFLPEEGKFVAGEPDAPPVEGAIWHGYHETAERVLTLYAQGEMGMNRLAYLMNSENRGYRDRKGIPRPINEDDIRRIIASWGVYGGLVTHRRSKDYKAYETQNVDEIPFKAERAVFSIDLLRAVARTRQERSRRPTNAGRKRKTKYYPLSQITYCAHCDELARKQNDPRLRSALNGVTMRDTRRYRHKHGVDCGCEMRSVPCELLDNDFKRLIDLLTIDENMLEHMTELAIEMDRSLRSSSVDPEQEKEEAIALCKRRINAAVQLFGDGYIDVEEYKHRVDKNERELAYWQSRTTEAEKAGVELAMCLEALDTISRLWDMSDDEDKQGMARNLFTEIVYNLDTQRIVSFKLKPWAERFLMIRASLYEELDAEKEENTEQVENQKVADNDDSNLQHPMPHTGLRSRPRFDYLPEAIRFLQYLHYKGKQLTFYSNTKLSRNRQIKIRYASGESVSKIAGVFDISEQRVHQILKGRRK